MKKSVILSTLLMGVMGYQNVSGENQTYPSLDPYNIKSLDGAGVITDDMGTATPEERYMTGDRLVKY